MAVMTVETVEAPEQTLVVLNPTAEQQAILNMIELVENNHWCRNSTDDLHGHACMLGLLSIVAPFHESNRLTPTIGLVIVDELSRARQAELQDPKRRTGADNEQVLSLLHRAIPKGEVEALRRRHGRIGPYGGNVYEGVSSACEVATYNNTRRNKREIIAWLRRALELTF